MEVEEAEAEPHQENTTVTTRTSIARDHPLQEATAEAQLTATIRTDTTWEMEEESSKDTTTREMPTAHAAAQDPQYNPITNILEVKTPVLPLLVLPHLNHQKEWTR